MRFLNIVIFVLIAAKSFSEIPYSYDMGEKPFVILVASYNNAKYARENIISVINQRYSNYRIIFINDCSSDNTLKIVEETIKEYEAEDKVTVIDNKVRKLGLRNYYEVIVNHTKDEEIVTCVDGDDFLANKNVLWILNRVYSNTKKEVWLTYGQFVGLNSKLKGWNRKIPKEVIENNDFRALVNTPTHLRTFYSWVFKRINKEDLCYEDNFFEMAWDLAFMFPMLEMSGGRFTLIEKLLYIYNDNNPISDYRVDGGLQMFYANYIRKLKKYKPLNHDVFIKCNSIDCVVCNKNIESCYQ